ncbi:hypothetical protein [Sphingomonas mali]|uniref:hypothetical protein n=1 Tax=Sphingomonas mali TaxID=40682 RepID=UPI000829BDFF|nr:hypothetical protein [Sphingomonas mali]
MIASLFAILLLQAAPAAAPVCTATVAPPAGLEAWSVAPGMTADVIAPGKTIALTLQPVDGVTFPLPLPRKPAPGTFGGVYHVTIATAGTYRVALQNAGWIDLVRDGKSLTSVGHMEGPTCSGIRKIVDFALQPGRYTLQLSGAKTAQMRILIATK